MGLGLKYNDKVWVGEHLIQLPPLPKDKREILFVDNKPEEAYWNIADGNGKIIATRREPYNELFKQFIPYKTKVDTTHTKYDDNTGELLQLSVDDTKAIRRIYEEEKRKRSKGVFIRNGDEIEYLTRSHWFTLQHCKMFGNGNNDGYGFFYKYQRDIFYLLEYMWKDWILGLYISKAKKTGITQIIDGGYCVDMATSQFQWMIGFMSRNEDVAIENNMRLFLHAFDNLPLALRPKVGYKAPKGGNIEFSELAKSKILKSNTDAVLNTKVFCGPTSEHTFDSHFMNIIRMDEYPKYWQDSKKEPKEILTGNKAGAKDQDFLRGRVVISSYPPEVDDIGSEQGGEVFRQSKLGTIKHGKTESELIAYHIPAFKSLKSCILVSGDCDEKKAMEILMQNRERVKKDRKALLAEIRQNPNNEDEAFGSNTAGSVFNTARLVEISRNIEAEVRESPKSPYMEGRFEWTNYKWEIGLKNKRPKGEFCPVKFIPLTDEEIARGETGRVRIFRDLPDNLKNAILRNGKDEFGCIIPPSIYKYVYGGDPTQHAAASEVIEGSKNSITIMSRKDERLDALYGTVATGTIDIQYLDRPELPDEAYEDFIKMIIYTGALGIPEANVPEWATRMISEGLGAFIIVKDKEGNKKIWKRWMGLAHEPEKEYNLIRTTGNSPDTKYMLEAFVRLMIAYIEKPTAGEKDYGLTIKDERLIEQLKKITKIWETGGSTKLFDMFMSWGYALYADDIYSGILLDGQEDMLSGNYFGALMSALSR